MSPSPLAVLKAISALLQALEISFSTELRYDTSNVIAWWTPEFSRSPWVFWIDGHERNEDYLSFKFSKHNTNKLGDKDPLQYETEVEYENDAGKLLQEYLQINIRIQ